MLSSAESEAMYAKVVGALQNWTGWFEIVRSSPADFVQHANQAQVVELFSGSAAKATYVEAGMRQLSAEFTPDHYRATESSCDDPEQVVYLVMIPE